jgi:hypothetical protein
MKGIWGFAAFFITSTLASNPNFAEASSLPANGPYNFTGTVVSASPTCLHPSSVKVLGYAIFPGISTGDPQYGQPPTFDHHVTQGHFNIVFSNGTAIKKIAYALEVDGSFKKPYTQAQGPLTVQNPSPLSTKKGTWTGTFTYDTSAKFALKFRLEFPVSETASCSAEYSLSFVRGIPSKFLDLL